MANYEAAVTAIQKVQTLKHFRASTAQNAVTAVLGCIGAKRIQAATQGYVDAANDRRLIGLLSDAETVIDRLAALPWRVEFAEQRSQAWYSIVGILSRVRVLIEREESTERVAAERGAA